MRLRPIYFGTMESKPYILDTNYTTKHSDCKVFLLLNIVNGKAKELDLYQTDIPHFEVLDNIFTPFYYLPWSDTVDKYSKLYPELFL